MRHLDKNVCFFGLCIMLLVCLTSNPSVRSKRTNHEPGNKESLQEPTMWDNICGPRCVCHVLSIYGESDVSLLEIIRSCQWPTLEEGAAIGRIQECLDQHGIHSKLLRLLEGETISWKEPAIAIMKTGGRLDHYVVLEPAGPAGGSHPWIWDPAGPMRTGSIKGSFYAVLLTSRSQIIDEPIYLNTAQALWKRNEVWITILLLMVNIGLFTLFRVTPRWRKCSV